jgi:hypothetical protein
MAKVKEESWTLNSADTTAIPSANRGDGTASVWSDIWKYQVPTGQAHVLKPRHRFAAYLEDASTEVSNGTCRIRIVVRDQSEQDEKAIYGPSLYVASKEFQDAEKMASLALGADLAIEERFFIVIQVYDDGAIDESDSYFKLETIRIRSSI